MDEQQQDANSALMELDKGLRASKVGEQCEAIVKFPSLFERLPFPILINSAFLKLADTFRTGNNFIRLCILQVAQQSKKHLDKIINVDEFTKRIYTVIHSNDPYARALTLRMLGSVSCMISEKKNAHHSIQQGLDSHDRVEQEAAIFATTQFASHSHQFASGICNKIAAMLQGLSTPLEIKLKLIPVLQHMHYDVQISSKAKDILHELLPAYPAQDFVLTTLNTLTQLALHSLVDIPDQVTLLLQYIRCDPREAVKSESLHNLNLLASQAPHLWTEQDISALCEAYKLSTLAIPLKREILSVLCALADSSKPVRLDFDEGAPVVELCRQCCYDFDVIQAALATKLFASLCKHSARTNEREHVALHVAAAEAAEALLMLVTPASEYSVKDRNALKIVLPSLKHLCHTSPNMTSRLVKLLLSFLIDDEVSVKTDTAKLLLETTADIALTSPSIAILCESQKQMFELLRVVSTAEETEDSVLVQQIALILCMILFMGNQERQGSVSNKMIQDALLSSSFNHWTLYKIARQASRLGQHDLAREMFTRIADSVASEHHYFWLLALSNLSEAESILAENLSCSSLATDKAKKLSHLNKAISEYHQGATTLAAAVTPNHYLLFQCEYVKLRRETLQAHAQLLNACSLIRTCPPPAISTMTCNAGSSSSADSHAGKGGILMTQMKACAELFLAVDRGYSELHMTSFDSDYRTLSIIEILQQSCSIMAYIVDLLILSRSNGQAALQNSSFESAAPTKYDDYYTRAMKGLFSKVLSQVEKVLRSDNSSPLSHVHTDCLIQCSYMLLSVPHSFPRYFYQSLQTTNIKLAISPNQRNANEPVSVEINQRMALKVEGVIQHTHSHDDDAPSSVHDEGSKGRSKFRDVSKIRLTAKKTKQGSSKPSNIKVDENDLTLEQIVEPHNDYFSSQFLISFLVAGIYNVVVETSVKDSEGVWWKTGPRETVVVKAYDDAVRIQQQIAQATPRPNSRF